MVVVSVPDDKKVNYDSDVFAIGQNGVSEFCFDTLSSNKFEINKKFQVTSKNLGIS